MFSPITARAATHAMSPATTGPASGQANAAAMASVNPQIQRRRTVFLRQTEVGDLEHALAVQQQIGWFEIAMDDAFVVGDGERARDLHDDRGGLG